MAGEGRSIFSLDTSNMPMADNINFDIKYTAVTWPIKGRDKIANKEVILTAFRPVTLQDSIINLFLSISFFLYFLNKLYTANDELIIVSGGAVSINLSIKVESYFSNFIKKSSTFLDISSLDITDVFHPYLFATY